MYVRVQLQSNNALVTTITDYLNFGLKNCQISVGLKRKILKIGGEYHCTCSHNYIIITYSYAYVVRRSG